MKDSPGRVLKIFTAFFLIAIVPLGFFVGKALAVILMSASIAIGLTILWLDWNRKT
jgi:hypothetical protein